VIDVCYGQTQLLLLSSSRSEKKNSDFGGKKTDLQKELESEE
jgi:hypothetical protein